METTIEFKIKESFKWFPDTMHHLTQLNKSIWKNSHVIDCRKPENYSESENVQINYLSLMQLKYLLNRSSSDWLKLTVNNFILLLLKL